MFVKSCDIIPLTAPGKLFETVDSNWSTPGSRLNCWTAAIAPAGARGIFTKQLTVAMRKKSQLTIKFPLGNVKLFKRETEKLARSKEEFIQYFTCTAAPPPFLG